MITRMGIGQFKSALRRPEASKSPNTLLHKSATLTIEPTGDDTRRLLFTISTEAVDRDNDTISLKGWQLDAYRKNPVVLWNHDSYSFPVGKTVEIQTAGGALKAVVEFVPSDMPMGIGELADAVYRMCDAGFLCACSVGFRPLEFAVAKDRMDDDDWWPPVDFTKQELLEWSICTIPANPDATIEQERASSPAITRATELNSVEQELAEAAAKALRDALLLRRRQLRAACF